MANFSNDDVGKGIDEIIENLKQIAELIREDPKKVINLFNTEIELHAQVIFIGIKNGDIDGTEIGVTSEEIKNKPEEDEKIKDKIKKWLKRVKWWEVLKAMLGKLNSIAASLVPAFPITPTDNKGGVKCQEIYHPDNMERTFEMLDENNTKLDDILWQSFKQHIESNFEIMNVSDDGKFLLYEFDNDEYPGERSRSSLIINDYVTTLGIDIKDYSKCNTHERLISSTTLYACIERSFGWFEKERPDLSIRSKVIIPTGDGALIVFKTHAKSIIEAIQFSLILNLCFYAHNIDIPVVGSKVDKVKIPVRFALGCGNAIFIRDVNGNKNLIGDTVISCSRLLSVDNETHLLIDKKTANCLIKNFRSIKEGIDFAGKELFKNLKVNVAGPFKKEIKSTIYQFYNVKIIYHLNSLMDSQYKQRQENIEDKILQIGMNWKK